MKRTEIVNISEKTGWGQLLKVAGWVRAFRQNRFLIINDGSCFNSLQIVVDADNFPEELIRKISVSSSVKVVGELVASQGSGQGFELLAKDLVVLGHSKTEDVQGTILQPKRHNMDKLREQAHLRFRTNTFGAVFRIRHAVSYAIHKYFNDNGYFYMNTPIITGSDAEGAGEMFRVSTLSFENYPKTEDGKVDYSQDFFGKETNLTVSGQLEAEMAALGLGKVYTFGPTFRAENSNTSRHLAEFWMIEPEVAFNELKENMDLGEAFLQSVIQYVLKNCLDDLSFLAEREAKEQSQKPTNERHEMGLIERMEFVVNNEFIRLTYTEAIDVLMQSKPYKKKQFKFPVAWGIDLQSEHERYLVEKHFKKPVILTDYPKEIKAFYMRLNEDNKTVAAMDILFPGIGEIMGGSQREERYEVLKSKIEAMGIPEEELWWYLDSRKFGTVKHAGFGLGLERLVMFVTGMTNIRDVIPFPRTPKNAEF